MAYTSLCDNEISGLGYVRRPDSKTIIIDEVFLLKQEVDKGNTTFCPKAYMDFTVKLADENEAREDRGEEPLLLRLQWHSHFNLAAGFSAADERVIDNCQTDWRVSLCVNQAGDYAVRLDVYKPFRSTIEAVFDIVLPDMADDEMTAIMREIDELVTERPPPEPVNVFGAQNDGYVSPPYYAKGGYYGAKNYYDYP